MWVRQGPFAAVSANAPAGRPALHRTRQPVRRGSTGENGRPLCGAEIAMSKDGFGSTSGVGRQGVTVGYAADSSRTPGDDPSSGLAVGAEDACRPAPVIRHCQVSGGLACC